MLRRFMLASALLALILANASTAQAQAKSADDGLQRRITKIDPAPKDAKDKDLLGTLHIEWKPKMPQGLDRAMVRIDKRTKLTLDGKPAQFEDLKPGMRVEFTAWTSALIYPPLYFATEVHAFRDK
jgi:hypothetical protein